VFHRRPLERGFRYIVNATPVDPVPEYEFDGTECVYDLRYVPSVTPLLERAAAAGCRVENGFSMLEAQARLQRRLFFNEIA
jgi:3-dehydroquinate dehydratase/shikimate dehydrogenase